MGSRISSKKQTNKFVSTTMIPQVDLFLFVFWRKSTTPKNHFKINWHLKLLKDFFEKDNKINSFLRCHHHFYSQWQFSRENVWLLKFSPNLCISQFLKSRIKFHHCMKDLIPFCSQSNSNIYQQSKSTGTETANQTNS